ncbi:MAG: GNAT family N-acetyltransferase [Acidobacteriaceae bacterium]
MSLKLRKAVAEEAEQIATLTNRAFAVERFFKAGDRTDPEQVRELMSSGEFLVLAEEARISASCYVEIHGERAYLGMLSVDPSLQKSGLGKRMMQEAEEYCRGMGCRFLDIKIVNLREELPPYYRKHGFVETGTASGDFIADATMPLHMIMMTKDLTA